MDIYGKRFKQLGAVKQANDNWNRIITFMVGCGVIRGEQMITLIR